MSKLKSIFPLQKGAVFLGLLSRPSDMAGELFFNNAVKTTTMFRVLDETNKNEYKFSTILKRCNFVLHIAAGPELFRL